MSKYVYLFSEVDRAEAAVGGSWDAVRGLLGGKGANLADMARLGVPVPPGFTVTTEACNAYLEAGGASLEGLFDEVFAALAALEGETGKKFGDVDTPLLLSCRSGAKFSMPGMMDTVLNLGLNDEITEALAQRTGDARLPFDLYRRLIQMYASVVMGVDGDALERVISARRKERGATLDADLDGDDWRAICDGLSEVIRSATGEDFPQDPRRQLTSSIESVFGSWNGKRAVDYRNATGIAHDLGTAVNVQTMVFGNLDAESSTGVCMSRNGTTGEPELEGDYLEHAQGEDVVAGIRETHPISVLSERNPAIYEELRGIAKRLEEHHKDMQDLEFTIESGHLWILQTRDGKRTAEAEVRIAVDMADEGLIERGEALSRVSPEQVDVFLHPKLDPAAMSAVPPLARGLAVSPGAAVGQVVFDADTADVWAKEGRDVILVRPDTKPDDVHGMLAARGIVTTRGGRTSHAALVARQFGRPAVVGVVEMEVDAAARQLRVGDAVVEEGEWVSVDGTRGLVFPGKLPTVTPDLENPTLTKLLSWADDVRRLGVRANADYPEDAVRARAYGAEGIGLCRTEHMFFEVDRLPIVQRMIMASDADTRAEALAELLPMQRADFEGLFRAMDGLPVIIRLIDPPLHEFLPDHDELVHDIAELKVHLQHVQTLSDIDQALSDITTKQSYLERVDSLREENPMLGTRGVRLGMLIPGLVRMQVRAIFEAACVCVADGVAVLPEIMVPLVAHVAELRAMREVLESEARAVLDEHDVELEYLFGSMIEIPRAAITAAEIAQEAEFFSFGTNDLTQTTFGISRDDAEQGFLVEYLQRRILAANPFETIDVDGVGRLMEWAVREGRRARPGLEIGICGEHGGDPASIAFCHRLGLDYVSCSPFRVPIARLAAAHAALAGSEASA